MTLQSSGSMTGADIRNELKQSGGNLVFPDVTTRWLADQSSGSLILPTHYYGKTAIKRVHSELLTGNSTVFSTTANLGLEYPGRLLVICVGVVATSNASQIFTSGNIILGDLSVPASNGPGQAWFNGGVNILTGIVWGTTTGTTRGFQMTCNQNMANLQLVIYSVAGTQGSAQNSSGSGSNTSASTTLNVTAGIGGGVVIMSGLKASAPGQSFTYTSGANKDTDQDIGNNVRYSTGFLNRIATNASHGLSWTCGGAANICAVAGVTFS